MSSENKQKKKNKTKSKNSSKENKTENKKHQAIKENEVVCALYTLRIINQLGAFRSWKEPT